MTEGGVGGAFIKSILRRLTTVTVQCRRHISGLVQEMAQPPLFGLLILAEVNRLLTNHVHCQRQRKCSPWPHSANNAFSCPATNGHHMSDSSIAWLWTIHTVAIVSALALRLFARCIVTGCSDNDKPFIEPTRADSYLRKCWQWTHQIHLNFPACFFKKEKVAIYNPVNELSNNTALLGSTWTPTVLVWHWSQSSQTEWLIVSLAINKRSSVHNECI